ncbi:MAG: DUF1947 domain-containing protein [Candidatus Thermoplasmatota archaeon]|nr:DUF1947 domain-containing protein [Candidatus Thermoplasmatota archaeon]
MTATIKNRHRLKRKEIQQLQERISRFFTLDAFPNHVTVERGQIEGTTFFFVDGSPLLFLHDDQLFFTLQGIAHYHPHEKRVVVDMGAVKFVTNGADVMAPGIVDADEAIVPGDHVWICDERHHKTLAIGVAILDGVQMKQQQKGKAIALVHYVGDQWWKHIAKSL